MRDLMDREHARHATIIAYSQRFAGAMPKYEYRYDGDFDYQTVANSCPVPKEGADLREHERCWQTLYDNFQKTWIGD